MTLSPAAYPAKPNVDPWLIHAPTMAAYLVRLALQSPVLPLGHYETGQWHLTDCGGIVAAEWVRSAASRKGITLDQWAITPDGLQGIVFVHVPPATVDPSALSPGLSNQKPWLLSSFVTSFKAAAAKRINLRHSQLGQPVWQPSYQEYRINDSHTLDQVRHQISTAPSHAEGL